MGAQLRTCRFRYGGLKMNIKHRDTSVFKRSYLTFDVDGDEYTAIHTENVSDDDFEILDNENKHIDEAHELYTPIKELTEQILNVKID